MAAQISFCGSIVGIPCLVRSSAANGSWSTGINLTFLFTRFVLELYVISSIAAVPWTPGVGLLMCLSAFGQIF